MCKFSSGDTIGNQNLVSDIGMKSENLSTDIEDLLDNNNITSPSNQICKGSKDDEDLFGPVGFTMSSGRPTMMSAKYLEKEERRKVLKISVNKLKKIEDPESSLRRSVLINNTMKRLQRETREDKQKNSSYKRSTYLAAPRASTVDQLVDITNLPVTTTPAPSGKTGKPEALGCKEPMPMDLLDSITSPSATETLTYQTPASRCAAGRKRSLDDIDDCDVTDVLSQFYMPPTPRLLTSISDDEDEELNVVDIDCSPCKKPRIECSDFSLSCHLDSDSFRSSSLRNCSDFRTSDFSMSDPDLLLEPSPSLQSSQSSYSCGHSSVFNDIQSVVFHSLIASLET